ncbi:hypothetical protein [Microvirga massiliensis]|uniref:hypothetical protein n=1 Tax=Microvirga massiliensis TaxID=1033741 RepID=UPI00069B66E3|nr:hypothetical protein [Microvirga massiliensis]
MRISERSLEPITRQTLDRLSLLCCQGMEAFFAQNPRWAGYRSRFLYSVLAQGAALHYLDGRNGVKDFDCWAFYAFDERIGPLPPRGRRGKLDFGSSEFGRHPDDEGFQGRRVDVLARSIRSNTARDGILAVQEYLRTDRNDTPRLLAQKAVVVLEPAERRGEVIWYPTAAADATRCL